MTMKVAIIGPGHVGSTIGRRLMEKGFAVKYGSRNPAKSLALQHTLSVQPGAAGATVPEAVHWGEVVVLATPCMHENSKLRSVAHSLGAHVAGKVLIDVTNPFSSDLSVRWKEGTSAAEELQRDVPGTYVYKAFNTIGVEHMAHPGGELITGERLTCLFAGPEEHKDKCEAIIDAVGLIPEYVGPIRYARNLEAMAELYVHLGSGLGGVKWGRNFHFQVIRNRD